MTEFADGLADYVDGRIAKAVQKFTSPGTVVTATADSVNVDVIMDGSNASTPCKTYRNVRCKKGDRVGLVKFGSDWVVVGTYGFSGWPKVYGTTDFCSSANTTSGTYSAMPVAPFTYTKEFDATKSWMFLSVEVFVLTNGDTPMCSLSFNGVDPGDFPLFLQAFGTTGRFAMAGFWTRAGDLAGTYTVQPVWKRYTGTGQVSADQWCTVSAWALEVSPTSR